MKHRKFFRLFYFLLIITGLSIGNNVYSQTVVQWYTSMGDFRSQLREDLVPMTAQNFIDLTNANFYDDLIFHRVIIEFMIQDGCPIGNGPVAPVTLLMMNSILTCATMNQGYCPWPIPDPIPMGHNISLL